MKKMMLLVIVLLITGCSSSIATPVSQEKPVSETYTSDIKQILEHINRKQLNLEYELYLFALSDIDSEVENEIKVLENMISDTNSLISKLNQLTVLDKYKTFHTDFTSELKNYVGVLQEEKSFYAVNRIKAQVITKSIQDKPGLYAIEESNSLREKYNSIIQKVKSSIETLKVKTADFKAFIDKKN